MESEKPARISIDGSVVLAAAKRAWTAFGGQAMTRDQFGAAVLEVFADPALGDAIDEAGERLWHNGRRVANDGE